MHLQWVAKHVHNWKVSTDQKPEQTAESVVVREIPVSMLCETIALFNRCDWADVCGEVSDLIERLALLIADDVSG